MVKVKARGSKGYFNLPVTVPAETSVRVSIRYENAEKFSFALSTERIGAILGAFPDK